MLRLPPSGNITIRNCPNLQSLDGLNFSQPAAPVYQLKLENLPALTDFGGIAVSYVSGADGAGFVLDTTGISDFQSIGAFQGTAVCCLRVCDHSILMAPFRNSGVQVAGLSSAAFLVRNNPNLISFDGYVLVRPFF